MIQNDDCPICYDSIENYNFAELSECHHRFCKCCINEIVFNWKQKCPIDRSKIEGIINFQLNEDDNKYIFKNQSIHEYSFSIMKDEPKLIIENIQATWSERILQIIKIIQKINKIYDAKKNHFKMLLGNNSQIDQQNNIDNQMRIINEMINDLSILESSEIFRETNKESVFRDFSRWKYNGKKTLFMFNLEDSNFLNYRLYNEFPDFHYKIDSRIYEEKFIKNTLNNIDNSKLRCNIMSKYIINCTLSFLNNNIDTFRYLQPDFNKSDLNKCLICTNEITNEIIFATFSQCQHKICKHCIDQFLISHASCPFDGDEINDLIMFADNERNKCENVFNYLEREIGNIKIKMILKWKSLNENIVKHLIDNNDLFNRLIEQMELIVQTKKSKQYEPNQLKSMIIDLEKIYTNLQHEELINMLFNNARKFRFSQCYSAFKLKLAGKVSMTHKSVGYIHQYSDYMRFLESIIEISNKIYSMDFVLTERFTYCLERVISLYCELSFPVSIKSEKRKISMRKFHEWIVKLERHHW